MSSDSQNNILTNPEGVATAVLAVLEAVGGASRPAARTPHPSPPPHGGREQEVRNANG